MQGQTGLPGSPRDGGTPGDAVPPGPSGQGCQDGKDGGNGRTRPLVSVLQVRGMFL